MLLPSKLLPLFIYPLGLACVLVAVGLLRGRSAAWRRTALGGALLLLWMSGSRCVAVPLVRSLEWRDLPPATLPNAPVIVVLGGGTLPPVPPRQGVELNEAGDRLLYAARLFREGKAPRVLASAGRISWSNPSTPESADMAAILQTLGVPESAIVEEGRSRNTHENAMQSRRILAAEGIRQILLVTSAIHMPRAAQEFRSEGFDVVPAPTDFWVTEMDASGFGDRSFEAIALAVVPDAESFAYTTRALKEYLGLAVCWLRRSGG